MTNTSEKCEASNLFGTDVEPRRAATVIDIDANISTGSVSISVSLTRRISRSARSRLRCSFEDRYATSRAARRIRAQRVASLINAWPRLIACNAKFIAGASSLAARRASERLNEYKCGIIIRRSQALLSRSSRARNLPYESPS